MPAQARSRRPVARAGAVALPRGRRRLPGRGTRTALRLVPSRRSLAVGLGILAVALGSYAIARETSLFAIERVDVRGGSAQVDAQVRQALAAVVGTSLVGLDGADVVRRAVALPWVVSASYDRAFPNTLRLTIVPERPVAVLRRGVDAWLVSARGRVLQPLPANARRRLPRIWLAAARPVRLGAVLPAADGGAEARALAFAGPFRSRIATASLTGGSLVFRLRTGIELLLGAPSAVRLKLAVATRALQLLPAGSTVLDLSVPGRPVSGTAPPAAASTGKPSGRG